MLIVKYLVTVCVSKHLLCSMLLLYALGILMVYRQMRCFKKEKQLVLLLTWPDMHLTELSLKIK